MSVFTRLRQRFDIVPMLDEARALRARGEYGAAADTYDVAADALEEAQDMTVAAHARRQAWGLRRHGESWQTVKVVFRVYRRDGDVIALMPELFEEGRPNLVTIYQHAGQHGEASYAGVMRSTSPATPKEYRPLFDELTRIGYDVVPIERRRRRTP